MLRRWLTLLAIGALPAIAAGVACSATPDRSSGSGFGGNGGGDTLGAGASGTGASDSTGGGGSTGALMFDGGAGGGGPNHDCAVANTLVYVVSQENTLYSFDPGALQFTLVGTLDCPIGSQPFSMAVDRFGHAWVLYQGGRIWQVDITNAHCVATPYQPNQHGFSQFGMGYAADTPGSSQDTLYLANYGGGGIAKLDTSTWVLTPVGQYDQIHAAAELTGTGDARLFGFFETATIQIAEIDKTNAHIISKHPEPNISIGSAWAFAFWGGSFWLFTNPSGSGSQVDQYDPVAGTTNTVIQDVGGFSIVGAGVSTCAPVNPPH